MTDSAATPTRETTDDWWDRLYAPATHDTSPPAPRRVRPVTGQSGRLPDWRTGQHINLTKPAPDDEDTSPDVVPDTDDTGPDNEPADNTPVQDSEDTAPDTAVTKHPPSNRRPPIFDTRPRPPRQSLADLLRHLPTKWRWLLYNGTASTAGWALGAPQFVTAETTYLAQAHGPTNPYVLFWYAIAAAILTFDWRTRGWWPGLAWACRIPAASTTLGVLLYTPGTL